MRPLLQFIRGDLWSVLTVSGLANLGSALCENADSEMHLELLRD